MAQHWTAQGKLLLTTLSSSQSLRFTWKHRVETDDIITIGDTLGVRQLVLHERDGVLFERLADNSLQPIENRPLKGELSALNSLVFKDLASALTGEKISSEVISTEVMDWLSVDGTIAPRVIRVTVADLGLKVVIKRWELTKNG